MNKTSPPIYHYSQLRYENVSPYRKGGDCRVWFLEQELSLLNFYKEVGKDLLYLARKLAVWIKVNYRKEMLVAAIMTLAFSSKGYAVAPPKPIKVPVYVQPSYIKPVAHLEAVQPISVPVPEPVAPVAVPVPVTPPPAPVSAPVNNTPSGCGDNFYAHYIYMHESGCRTDAIGPNGPCGLGQALPCSKMGCSLSDYVCQNAWFTNYALERYGSWATAYDYWVAHHNW